MPDPCFAARLLRQEIVLSVGCTEPAAIALATAAAASDGGTGIRRISVRADIGTYKNALAVGLPGTTRRGPAIAAAAGALACRPELGLGILGTLDDQAWSNAAALCDAHKVDVRPAPWRAVRIEATVEARNGTTRASIHGRHDRLEGSGRAPDTAELGDPEISARLGSAADLLEAARSLRDTDLEPVRQALAINERLAEFGLAQDVGWATGRAFLATGRDDPVTLTKARVSAAIDARMSGAALPAATSGGSGNSGIVVSVGTATAARAIGNWPELQILRALGLAHLVNISVKTRIGRVGPLCGGAQASAMGVGCALAWLMGGDEPAIDRVIRHVANATSGSLCDGAKPGCALRIAAGLSVALDAARLAAGGLGRLGSAGLGGDNAATALKRLEWLSEHAFSNVDAALVELLAADQVEPDDDIRL